VEVQHKVDLRTFKGSAAVTSKSVCCWLQGYNTKCRYFTVEVSSVI